MKKIFSILFALVLMVGLGLVTAPPVLAENTKMVTDGIIDARDEADTQVVVTGTATVTVARYDKNPGGPAPTGSSSLDKYIDVYVTDTTEATELEIRLYYTAAEVAAAGIDEESLWLFWWNGTDWVECSDGGVNTSDITIDNHDYSGYMWAKITATTTPTLSQLTGTPFGGYGHPSSIYVPGDYPTIQEAIDAASPSDTIMVAAGDYHAFVVEGKPNISIISTEGATVTTAEVFPIDVGPIGDAWVMAAVYDSQNINIEGINFDGTGVSGKAVAVGIAYVDSTGRIADLTVENVIATELGAGVAIISDRDTSTVEITGATISNNDDAGIYVCGGSTLEAHLNKIVDNVECGVLNDGGTTVDATENWWGHASGPLHQTNPFGRGNAVIGDVDFEPWLEVGVVGVVIKTVTDGGTVDAIDEADIEVLVSSTATVIVAGYEDNPHPSGSAPTDLNPLHKYGDVRVDNATDVHEIEIRLYYTDGEVAEADVDDESLLQLLWWDGDEWKECSHSGVNTTDITIDNYDYSGYMWATINNTTTPSLADLQGTPWGGYGHPTEVGGVCGCFIATTAYGTDTAKEIDILREFRDKALLPNALGATLVSFYYETSPPIADFVSRHEVLARLVRLGFLDPVVGILNWSHALWSARDSQ